MRVLHVVDSCQLRGAELFASDLMRSLRGVDMSQIVAVLPEGGAQGVSYDAPTYALSPDGWEIPVLRVQLKPLKDLRKLIGRWRPDVVQAHGGDSFKYTMLASAGRRTATVYRKIGITPSRLLGTVKRTGHAQLMRRTDRIVAVAESIRREIIEVFRVSADRVITIPNAVDLERMKTEGSAHDLRRALAISPKSPVILSVGALTWEKDPMTHVGIGARVLRQLPQAVHVMVGDGPLRSQVEKAIREQDLHGRLRLLPARPDVPDLMAMSDVLLLASRIEGMPGCLIEAGIMRLPVVAYGIAGVPEVVVDGVTGLLTSAGDREGLAARLLKLLDDPAAAMTMGEAASERCRSLFDIRAIAPAYLEVYEELVAS